MADVTFGSLFAGVGGFDRGFERAGMSCAWQVEKDESCQRVLAHHWPNVPRFEDVRELPPGDVVRPRVSRIDLGRRHPASRSPGMTHDAATIAAINRRIAEYDGYTDIEADPRLPGIWWGRKEPDASLERLPRYWHSADAVLPVMERLIRDAGWRIHVAPDWVNGMIGGREIEWTARDGDCGSLFRAPTLPAAACLAVVAVLDGSESA